MWHLIKLLKESVIRKINASIWFHCMKKATTSLIEDKKKDRAQRAHTHQNLLLVSLLLWYIMVAIYCFVWPPGKCGQAGKLARRLADKNGI